MTSIKRKRILGSFGAEIKQGFSFMADRIVSLYVRISSERAVGGSRIAYYLIFSIVELQRLYYLFHPSLIFVWGTPAVTNLIRLFCSFFQFSAFILKSASVSYKNNYFDFEISKGTLLGIIGGVVGIQGVYIILVFVGFLSLGDSRNLKSKAGIFYILSWMRIILSKTFFLPIFQLLSYSISCTYYEEFGTRKSSLDRRLACVLTSRAKINLFERFLFRLTTMANFLHIFLGLLSELFDFSIQGRFHFNYPKRNNYNELLLKLGSICLILYQQWAGYLSEFVMVCILFSFFAVQFIIRAKYNTNISPSIFKFEVAWSAVSFWLSFMLALKASAGLLFEDLLLSSALSIFCLIGYVTMCFEVRASPRLLDLKIEEGNDPGSIQKRLEDLSFLFNRYQANEKKAKLLLGGYIEQIQRSKEIEQSSPLLFEKVWSEDKKFSSYIKKENQAFLVYLSHKYVESLKKHPKHVGLKLSYLIFLTEKLNRFSTAYENIYKAEIDTDKLTLTSRYILKTLKTSIDEADQDTSLRRLDSTNQDSSTSAGSGSKLKVPKLIKERITLQMHKNLEKATSEFMGLWQIVNEENPAIDKINSRVKKAHKHISISRLFWTKNLKYLRSLPRLQELYGRFLKDVLDQGDEGSELINEAVKTLRRQSLEKLLLKNLSYLSEISNFPIPCFVVMKPASGDLVKIINCNNSLSARLGFLKRKLINRQLSIFFDEAQTPDARPSLKRMGKKRMTMLFNRKQSLYIRTASTLDPGAKTNLKNTSKSFIPIFKKLAKSKKKTSQVLILKKSNGFLATCISDYRLNTDSEGNQYLTFLCNFEKVTKPKAQILINSEGKILGNNSATVDVLNLSDKAELSLKSLGHSSITSLIAHSGIDMKGILSLGKASTKVKQSRSTKKEAQMKEFKPFQRTRLGDENGKTDNDKAKPKSQKIIKIKDRSFHLNTTKPANSVGGSILIELWRENLNKTPHNSGGELKESHERVPIEFGSFENSVYTRNSRVSKKYKNGFYFALNHKFEYFGSFEKRFSYKDSNLKFIRDPTHGVDSSRLSISSQLLLRLRNQAEGMENGHNPKKPKIDFSEGIRVKRLNKDGNLIDWFEGIDGESSDSEEDYKESLFFQKRYQLQKMKDLDDSHLQSLKNTRKGSQTNTNSKRTKKGKNRSLLKINQKGVNKAQASYLTSQQPYRDPLDDEELAVQAIHSLTSKNKLKATFKHTAMSRPLCFLIFSILFMNLCFISDKVFSTYTRVVISRDLQLFSQIDYAISFRMADLYNINSNLIQIAMINNGTDLSINLRDIGFERNNPELGMTKQQLVERRLKNIRESLESFERFNIEVLAAVDKITMAEGFSEFLNTKDVEIQKGSSVSNFSLNEGIRQMVGGIAGILDLPSEKITFYEPDVDFVLQNGRQKFLNKLIDFNIYSNIIKEDVILRQARSDTIAFYCSIVILVLNLSFLYSGVIAYYKSREDYIGVYYGFGQVSIEKLIEHCEKYLVYLRAREVDDEDIMMISEDSDEEEALIRGGNGQIQSRANFFGRPGRSTGMQNFEGGRLDLDEWMSRLRRKKRKGSLASWFGAAHFVLIGFFGVLMVLRQSTYIYQNNIIAESVEILETVDSIAVMEQRMYAGIIIMEYSMYDFGEFGKMFRKGKLNANRNRIVARLYDVNDKSLKGNVLHFDRTEVFKSTYLRIFTRDACTAYFNLTATQNNQYEVDLCEGTFRGLMKKGFGKVTVKFVEDLRRVNQFIVYYEKTKNKKWIFKDQKCPKYRYLKPFRNNIKCLYTSSLMNSLREVQTKYSKAFYRLVSKKAYDFVSASIDNFKYTTYSNIAYLFAAMIIPSLLIIMAIRIRSREDVKEEKIIIYIPLRMLKSNSRLVSFAAKMIKTAPSYIED